MAPTIPAPITTIAFTIDAFDGSSFTVPGNAAMAEVTEMALQIALIPAAEQVFFRTQLGSTVWQTVAGSASAISTGITDNDVVALKPDNGGRIDTSGVFLATFSSAPRDVLVIAYLRPAGPPPRITK